MWSVYKKEFAVLLNSLIAYLAIAVFLLFIGIFMWVLPSSSVLDYGYADLETLFSFGPIAFLLLIPAITMRAFAEEKKEGTIELLLTKPITDTAIIIGKYIATCTVVALSLLPTSLYYFSVYQLGDPIGNIDSAAVLSSYIGLFLLGCVYVSIGIMTSALSSNQIVSFLLALILCYLFYNGFSHLASLDMWKGAANVLYYFGLDYHYLALSKGVVDIRNVFYFFTVVIFSLSITKLTLESRKW
jgi:ABC-2 type transport system permease protein